MTDTTTDHGSTQPGQSTAPRTPRTPHTPRSPVAFKPVIAVTPACAEQAGAAEARLQSALAEATETAGAFRFGPVQAAAKELPGASIVRIIPGFGLQEQAPTHVMVLTLKQAVRQALSLPLGDEAFWERVEETLTSAFIGLGDQLDAPHLVLHPADEGTRYDYHLLFALQDEETEGFLYVVAFCVHVTVGLDRDQVLGLSVTDPAPYTLGLDALCVRQPVG
ncbi:Type-2Aa cytolytic delta-endotoxin [Streptomyces sp. B-S-A8]|uniref:Type-2Aa cytolytic delta-endotoxin n=1 Tax=Streptomyces solicavernae TaxID=3043614 RepID=A0ABT6RKF4_9ACTN|nr:Type-2Aa cytolytic delta-endotoxin [Streptomyces sp. B-S-A8]MDI3384903.1 Type-2Aa cytolytic delta-endotoxin [Streptomyces sp. B-S-A8]